MSDGRYKAYPEYKDSGLAWLGAMPKTWELRKAKHLFERVQRPVRESDGIVTAFRDGQVTLRSNRREDGFTNAVKEIGYQGVRNGDLLVHAMDGFAGAIGVSDSDGKCSPVCSVCIPWNKSKIDIRYYGYLVRQLAVTDYITSLAKGIRERSTEFRFSEFSALELALPSKDEQSQIAAFLDHETAKIDQLIEKQQALISLLKEKRQAVISHAVTKGLNPHAPLKDSGIEWLGQVPAHWRILRVKTVSTFLTSGPRGWSERVGEEGALFIQSGDLNDRQGIEYATAKRVLVGNDAETDRTRLIEGDVVVCITGAKTGNVAVAESVPETAFINQHLCLVRPDTNIGPAFLGAFLKGQIGQIYFELSQYGLKQGLSLEDVKEAPVVLPPLNEQAAIVEYLRTNTSKFDSIIQEALEAVTLLQERRTALISAAVTGKIDVRHWQPPSPTDAAARHGKICHPVAQLT